MTATVPFTPEAVMAQAGAENFPVASRLAAGRGAAAHLRAIYGFARLVDDIGDEAPGDRLALLDDIDAQLDRIYAGEPGEPGEPAEHPLMRRLAATVAACRLPREPLARLVEANRQDQVVDRYETFGDLLGYCHLSADPVGELVLHVFGCATPERIALSDRICSALQIVEHLQDVAEDHASGRVYLPQQDLQRFGVTDRDLDFAAATAAPENVRSVLAFEADRADRMLDEGAPLVRTLPPRARLCVAAFLAGGRAALRSLERARYDVAGGMPPRPERLLVAQLPRAVRGR